MIKLLFLLPSYVFGGAERTSLNLLEKINKKEFTVSLVTSKNLFSFFQDIQIYKFISLEDIGIDVWFKSPYVFISDIKKIASLLASERPDVAFGMMHYPSALLVFAKIFYKIDSKVIVSPRGPSIEYLRYFENNLLRRAYLKFVFTFFCKNADGIIVASQGMKDECMKYFKAKGNKIAVIPNSVNFYEIDERLREEVNLKIPDGFKILSTSGRLEKEKNISFVLEAFKQIRKQVKVKLFIIGDGTEKYNLQAMSRKLKIEEDVIFTGYQSNPYKYIKKSDIFIHSCYFEGFANSIIEAMACGVPVISVDCPYGPGFIIKNGENGFLVPLNDKQALIDSVIELLNNNSLRLKIINNGIMNVKKYSVENMVSSYENFIEKIKESLI